MPEMKLNNNESLVLEGNRLFLRDDIHKDADKIEVVLAVKTKSLDQIRREFINRRSIFEDREETISELFGKQNIRMEV